MSDNGEALRGFFLGGIPGFDLLGDMPCRMPQHLEDECY